jgi:hypothetical protein
MDRIISWLLTNLPDSKLEILGQSEKSNYVEGGPINLRIIFHETDIQLVYEKWENKDGKSKNREFQLCLMIYEDWESSL